MLLILRSALLHQLGKDLNKLEVKKKWSQTSTPTQQRKCKKPIIIPDLQPQPLAPFKPLFLWIQVLLRLFTTNSDPELETAHPHILSFLFSKCPSAVCQKNAFQREVVWGKWSWRTGGPLLSVQLALFRPVPFFRRAGNVCFAARNWAFPTTTATMEENWNSAGFKRESHTGALLPSTDSEQVAGLRLSCHRALKTCSMVANSSHSCFIERWVRAKDRYWLAGRVSRQSLGV